MKKEIKKWVDKNILWLPNTKEVLVDTIELFIKNENNSLIKSLKEIAEGKGPYDTDQLKHASNCISDMKKIANNALKEININYVTRK